MKPAFWIAAIVLLLGHPLWSEARAEEERTRRTPAVVISDSSLRPPVLHLSSDQSPTWVNYSNRRARVTFAPEVAKKMICLRRSEFTRDASGVTSRPIQSQTFSSSCRLAPGTYKYSVELAEGLRDRNERELSGWIVVEPEPRPTTMAAGNRATRPTP